MPREAYSRLGRRKMWEPGSTCATTRYTTCFLFGGTRRCTQRSSRQGNSEATVLFQRWVEVRTIIPSRGWTCHHVEITLWFRAFRPPWLVWYHTLTGNLDSILFRPLRALVASRVQTTVADSDHSPCIGLAVSVPAVPLQYFFEKFLTCWTI